MTARAKGIDVITCHLHQSSFRIDSFDADIQILETKL